MVAIIADDNVVLDSLETSEMELVVWKLDMMEVNVMRKAVAMRYSYFLLNPMHADKHPS